MCITRAKKKKQGYHVGKGILPNTISDATLKILCHKKGAIMINMLLSNVTVRIDNKTGPRSRDRHSGLPTGCNF